MARFKRATKGRSRWLVLFSLLLVVLGAVPVLVDTASGDQAPAPETELASEESSPLPSGDELAEATQKAELKDEDREEELESPAAIAEREESQHAYKDLESTGAISDLLRSIFSEELASLELDPARYVTDSTLERNLKNEGGAVVSNEGQSELIESEVPAEVKDESGELGKVDLSLEATSEGFQPANPVVEVEIPASPTEGVAIEGGETTITQAGADPESSAQPFGEKDVIYSDVQTDTDLLVSPLSTGVELFDQLRSIESPETLRFDFGLPEGAHLHANAGVAEVYEGEKLLGMVSPPHAVDAQGTQVPVTMDVQEGSIVLNVAHREGDYAYPILVDPEYTQNDWVNCGWVNGGCTWVLEDNTFIPNANNGSLYWGKWCIRACWGSGRGLFVSFPSGNFGAQQYAQWTYTPPGETSYLTGYQIYPFWRYDYTSPCWSGPHPTPNDYDGLWTPEPPYNGWTAFYTNRSLGGNAVLYNSYGRVLVLGMSSGSGSNDPCWRDLYAGGMATYISDGDFPTLDPIAGYPTGWFDNSKTYSVNVSAHDHGLGVANVFLLPNGKPQVTLKPTNCYGTHDSPCYRDLAGPIYFNGNNFSEGKSEATVVANDALLRASTGQRWTAYVDNTPPEMTLSSQLAEATNEEGPVEKAQKLGKPGEDKLRLPVYNLKIEAEDGLKGSNATMRSGVKNIEIFLDKKTEPEAVPWKAQSCSGPEYSCKMFVNYPLSLTGLTGGTHIVKVVASDQLGHTRTREIEFKYIPATGMKDEYVMQHFPLPNGKGNEEEWPELAVNVMNGNLVYSEKDVDVPGYAADLEIERFYNSQLPKADNTEWGEGWTLAQTPQLETEGGAAPKEGELLDESGGLQAGVQLPTEAGASKFSASLQAKVTKQAGGGYALTDESGKSETTVAFNSNGDTEELRTGPYSSVDYNYAAGKLDEIAVKDPGSAPDLSAAEEEASEYVPPAPSFQSAFGALGSADGQLKSPGDIAVALNGDLFVVDRGNNRIERFNQEGKFVSKFGSEGTGNGQFKRPCSIAIDASGNLYVADAGNNRIEKFNEKGEFIKAVGSLGTGNAQFKEPEGITVDAKGNVLVADSYNQRIQKFNSSLEFLSKFGSSGSGNGQFNQVNSIDAGPGGKIWVIDWGLNRVTEFNEAGEFVQQFGSYGTGPGQFNHPDAIEVDSRGNVFVGDQSNNRVQQFNQAGKYQTKFGSAGSGSGQFSFTWPMGIAVDNKGGLWVTDVSNNRIEKWSVPNYRPSWFGAFGTVGTGDGQLKSPGDVAFAANGDLFVVDKGNNRIERFNREGKFVSKFGSAGSGNGQFSQPTSIAIDSSNHIWVTDGANNRVEVFTEEGKFVKAIGTNGSGNAQFYIPEGIATDLNGNVYVADTYNRRIQVFDEEGKFLFKFGSAGSGPGQFTEANAIDVGRHNEIYVADWGANRIEKFNEKGEYLLQFGSSGTGEGQFKQPDAVEADNKGNVWVGDQTNDRVELFNEAGEYITQFGKAGSGEGQFNFTYPMGIAADSSGGLWITDVVNNRIQKWQIPSTEAPKAPEANDPSLDVNLSAGLVSSVEGKEAGTNTYTHSGALLTANKGPDGEAKYEYDPTSKRLIKVTLPNGTWGSIAYEPTYGRVSKVTVDPAGAEPAKSTFFNYVDYPSRTTTVTPEGAQAVVYTIGPEGDVVESRNVKKPPVFDNVGGSLANYWEKEVPPGEQTFDIQAHADEGISSIQYVVNGQSLVHETTCNENLETVEVECKTVKSEWVLETENFAPGTLYVEVIIKDRLTPSETASKRFWVNIPQPPPPPPDGAPVKPKFSEVLSFREEFGLDVVDPPADEIARNERIFNLINAWTEGEPVARASRERWGVPLRLKDVAEMEYREWYYELDADRISRWVEETQPSNFAGYYMDQAAGGIVHVGFIKNQAEQLAGLEQSLSLVATDRLETYPTTPTVSYLSVRATSQAVTNAVDSNSTLKSLIIDIGEDESGKTVHLGATNVAEVENILGQMLGPNAPITVSYDAGDGNLLSGRFRNEGRMRAGDAIFNRHYTADVPPAHIANRMCTAGYGAKDNAGEVAGRTVWRLFVLTAGHCLSLNSGFEKVMYRSTDSNFSLGNEQNWKEVGEVTRDGLHHDAHVGTDAAAIRVENPGIAPQGIFGWNGNLIPTNPAGTAKIGDVVCFSGARSEEPQCGHIVARSTRWLFKDGDGYARGGYWVKFHKPAREGDSGAPAWRPGGKDQPRLSIGLVTASRGAGESETLVEPLLHPPNLEPGQVVGILHNTYMAPLSLKLGE